MYKYRSLSLASIPRAIQAPSGDHATVLGGRSDELVSSAQPDHRAPRGVLLVSSYIPELLGLCDRIAVMRRGRLSEPRPVGEWDAHSLMRAATGAEAA